MVRDETFSHSVMFLCFGAATLFLFIHWQSVTFNRSFKATKLQAAPRATEQQAFKVPTNGNHLLIELSKRRVYVYHFNQLQTSYPVAVGQRGWETPIGSFQVVQMQQHPAWRHPITGEVVTTGIENPLGDRWIGFWSDGKHHIGFHGTPQAELVGHAVSHGCLRMRNQDIRELYKQVSLGTLVVVRR